MKIFSPAPVLFPGFGIWFQVSWSCPGSGSGTETGKCSGYPGTGTPQRGMYSIFRGKYEGY